MAIFPNPTPALARARTNQNESYYAALLNTTYPGKGAGNAYKGLAAQFPSLTPYQVFQVFVEEIVGHGLAKAISEGISGVGTATAQAAGGAGAAATAVNPLAPLSGLAAIGDFFQRLTQPHTWIRVAEFAIGGILLVVGFNKMFPQVADTAQKAAATTAKVAGTAAIL